ncbi:amino acid ABC transporter substrate-binding protein [Microbispora rosea subsp. aerata]|nr:ABC transporter substrate-binding protein [Microbispora rosea]GGO02219.1 amino acid ABC transporter substrate-binding protein [Microbispora rosea subsp. aerata]GIH54671.1 amino acid ABC transporter substrate-binding protein [Microbispora rosea subsp. aerata]GLJ85806.1 amino acid ABC transporter substrate-binding protein [Microbispora rosea subsp. aerata]
MIRIAPLGRALAVAAAATLALTACGGGEDSAAPASSAPAAESSAPAAATAQGDGVLTIGTLLPQTGSLAFLGPPEFAGVGLAVKEINEAGGVLGKPVVQIDTDSGDTSTNIASQSVDKLLQQKVDVVVGAASSSVSLSVIDKITGAGVLQFSPANTSDQFTTYDDKGLYFRTAPPDVLQGRVLGDLILADGNDTVGILALQDAYGTGLADNVQKAVEGGGGQVVEKVIYDPKAADYSADVAKIKEANPKAVALIGFDETKKIIPELVKQGLTAKKVKYYFVDGNLSNYGTGADGFPKGTLEGAKGTQPGAQVSDAFKERLKTVDPSLKDFNYGPEAYDATMLTALAAVAAKSDAPKDIAAKLQEVSSGGEKCTDFKTCNDLLAAGKDIDYDGASGPIEFNEAGDPAEATIGIYQYGADNNNKNIGFNTGKIAG